MLPHPRGFLKLLKPTTPKMFTMMPAMFTGSDRAIERVQSLVDEWSLTRSGCLEALAEWVCTREGATLDDGLNAMKEQGRLDDWEP